MMQEVISPRDAGPHEISPRELRVDVAKPARESDRPKRSVSTGNNVTPHPRLVMLILKDGKSLRSNGSGKERGISVEKKPSESSRHHTFVYEYVDGISDAFLLRSAKTGLYLGVFERGGHLILYLFEYTFNRARELLFRKIPGDKKGTFKLQHITSGYFVDRVSKKPKTLGSVVMVSDEDEGRNMREEIVKHAWSFVSKTKKDKKEKGDNRGKAITAQSNGVLIMAPKGKLSWAPYFEFVAVDQTRERFRLKPVKHNNVSEELFVSMQEDGRVCLSKQPSVFVLVPTLKSASYFIRDCESKRYLKILDSGHVGATELLKAADLFGLVDAKDVSFSGMRSIPPISPSWQKLMELLQKLSKYPLSHAVYANLPGVFERQVSRFVSTYFIARCHDEKTLMAFCAELKLDSRENTLLKNAKDAFNMVPVLLSRETSLFKELERAIVSAKKGVSMSDKLFTRYAEKDHPHVTSIAQEDDDTFVRIALAGDFGSGKPKARSLLQALFSNEDTRPHIFIHLGDVYKKGTRREQNENLIQPLLDAIGKEGEPVRIYALPGNHDYLHKGGEGYYWALTELQRLDLSKQQCSFFCLDVGKSYSLIGLDTGLGSLQLASDSLEVKINDEQKEWLSTRMEECISEGRKIIMLSHHPVLSSGPQAFGTVNMHLWNTLSPFYEHVVAWFWGHEHSFKVYEPHTIEERTLQRARLIGHGSKWKKAKNNKLPFVKVDHPKAREIGLCLLEISEDDCHARYVELSGENQELTLVENFNETF